MTASKIEWTDRSDWNPIRGCTRVSPGCGGPGPHGGCYAESIAARFSDPGQAFHGFAERTSKGGRWTGKVELVEDRLTLPLRWKKPAKVFASSTSDVFHESLPDEAIDRIFAVMALCPHLTFQVLTKRSARMREYMGRLHTWSRNIGGQAFDVMIEATARQSGGVRETFPARCAGARQEALDQLDKGLPNVWLGVSVEDQQRADERIPDLLATPAAVRFISAEPLLGPVDLTNIQPADAPTDPKYALHALAGKEYGTGWVRETKYAGLDWVIVGGESGPNARPMHPDWARSLRDQCAAAGVAFHFKQHGEWAPHPEGRSEGFGSHGAIWHEDRWWIFKRGDRHCDVWKVGKKAAGRLLDGRTHDEFPA